ncbi:hypothetical protein [Pseudomonas brassicacearum]|uniref:hypothetical protein n=1 Tax=Pseudomonas brassicacearum TaxID=930166 RepID=UPI00223BC0D8|nr:hypothetical protein [Pseudomonas brassicacearum]
MLVLRKNIACLTLFFCLPAMAASSSDTASYTKTDVLDCEGTKIELVSNCQRDTVDVSQDHAGLPVCTDQIIKINGKENRRKIEKLSQLTTSGKNVKVLSNVVVSMACIKGSKGNLVFIGGYGGCGICPEWRGYYSMDGKLVNYVYSDSFRSFGSLGSREDLINKYGVKKRDLVDGSYLEQKVIYANP